MTVVLVAALVGMAYCCGQIAAVSIRPRRRAQAISEQIIAMATLAHPDDPFAACQYCRVHYPYTRTMSWNPVTWYRQEATYLGRDMARTHFLEEMRRVNNTAFAIRKEQILRQYGSSRCSR